MAYYRLALALALFGASSAAAAANAPIVATPCEYGIAHPWTTVECTTTLTNASDTTLVVQAVAGASPRVTGFDLPITLAANGAAQLTFKVATAGRAGQVRDLARLAVTGPDAEEPLDLVIQATGFVYSVLDQARPTLDFDVVDARDPQPKTLQLGSADLPDFRLQKIVSVPAFMTASLGAKGHVLTMKVRADAPWGLNTGAVVLTTNAKDEPEAQVVVNADVHGRVLPGDNPYAVGVLRQGQKNEVAVQLTSRDDKPFAIGDVRFERLHGSTRTESCVPRRTGCKMLIWTVGKVQRRGFVAGLMHVDLPDDKQTLTVGFEGMLVGPTTQVRDLSEVAEQQAAKRASGAESPAIGGQDFMQTLQSAMKNHEPPPAPAGSGPLLRWKVANQQALYGYLVYRAPTKDGPFQRVNKAIIEVVDPDGTASYVWRDASAEAGKTYWYYLATLANNGEKKPLSAAQKVLAQ